MTQEQWGMVNITPGEVAEKCVLNNLKCICGFSYSVIIWTTITRFQL